MNETIEDGRETTIMKIYNSFLIRCWLLRDPSQPDHPVFEVEHIQTGVRNRVASFAELQNLLLAILSSESKPVQSKSLAAGGGQKNEGDK